MIQFPKPFDWFQQKLWRIYWIEWAIIIILYRAVTRDRLIGYDFIYTPIIGGLIMVFLGKYIAKFYFELARLAAKITGAGFFHSIAELFETLMWIVIDINYRIISRFSEEKLPINPADKFFQKMGWK